MSMEHRLAAILFCDIVGYTATTQLDETEAARQIEEHRKTLEEYASVHHGNVLQYYGDGSLTIFPSVIDAVECALDLQEKLSEATVPLRAGIHLGEIYFKDDQFIGDGINIASRIQSEADTGQVLVSETVCDLVRNKPHLLTEHLGHRDLKNVDKSMSLYTISRVAHTSPKVRPARIPQKMTSNSKWKWLMGVLVMILIATYGITTLSPLHDDTNAATLAVFPFRSLSDDIEDKYLCLGIADDIRSTLARAEGFEVRSRSSSETVYEQNLSAQDIGKKLNIQYLLEGSFKRDDERVLVNLAVVDVNSDRTLTPIELSAGSIEELLPMMDDIVQKVIRAVSPAQSNGQLAPGLQSDSYQAYKYYLLGRSYLLRTITMEDLKKSEEYFRQAIMEDPSYGRAYAGLAEAFLTPAAWGYADMRDGLERARPLANKALQLAPDDAETQYILGTIKEFELNFKDAETNIKRAIELDPSNALGFARMARICMVDQEWDDATVYARKASQLDPLSSLIASVEPIVLIRSGEPEQAIELCERVLDDFPGDNNIKFHLGEALTMSGKYAEAIRTLRSRDVSTADVNFMLGYAYARNGQYDKATEVLNYLLEKRNRAYVPPAMIALIYYGMGDKDMTLDWLNKETNYFMLLFGPMRPLWTDQDFAHIYEFLDQDPI